MVPLHHEFGWSTTVMSAAVSVNLLLFGLMAPFAAALMDRLGIRLVVSGALTLIALGSAGSVVMTASWQLFVFWGLLIGTGTGSMALVLAATVTNRWFVRRRGLVMGVLTAAARRASWSSCRRWPRSPTASAGGSRRSSSAPSRSSRCPWCGSSSATTPQTGASSRTAPTRRRTSSLRSPRGRRRAAVDGLAYAVRQRAFWALAAAFAICGATTNGLIGCTSSPRRTTTGCPRRPPPACSRRGRLDIVGTIASGWLTDSVDPRLLLLLAYYAFRGVGLLLLPSLLSATMHPSMVLFVVVYGLDWVATVPPTAALCRELFGERGTIVFGWVFASHQVGAALAAFAAGVVRDTFGTYSYAFWGGAALCGSPPSCRCPRDPRHGQPPRAPDLCGRGSRGRGESPTVGRTAPDGGAT